MSVYLRGRCSFACWSTGPRPGYPSECAPWAPGSASGWTGSGVTTPGGVRQHPARGRRSSAHRRTSLLGVRSLLAPSRCGPVSAQVRLEMLQLRIRPGELPALELRHELADPVPLGPEHRELVLVLDQHGAGQAVIAHEGLPGGSPPLDRRGRPTTPRRGQASLSGAGDSGAAGGALGRLLGGAYGGEAVGVGHVGHRAAAALLAVKTSGLPPAGRVDAELLAEQGDEDACLLLAEAGQGLDPPQQLGAARRAAPQRGRV